MKQTEPFLTKSDAAREAQRSPAAIRAAADSGRLRVAMRTLDGTRLFRLEDVRAWCAQRRMANRRPAREAQ
jgi:hypothetical protein